MGSKAVWCMRWNSKASNSMFSRGGKKMSYSINGRWYGLATSISTSQTGNSQNVVPSMSTASWTLNIWLGLQASTTRIEHVDKNAGAILQDCGLEALKNTRLLTSSKKWVVDTSITKLTDIFELQWKVEINNMPKLRSYRELKSTFTCENYVKMLQPSSRSCMFRLRSGVFPLAIETGCWRGKPIEERLCPVCPQPVVETEEHFLLIELPPI